MNIFSSHFLFINIYHEKRISIAIEQNKLKRFKADYCFCCITDWKSRLPTLELTEEIEICSELSGKWTCSHHALVAFLAHFVVLIPFTTTASMLMVQTAKDFKCGLTNEWKCSNLSRTFYLTKTFVLISPKFSLLTCSLPIFLFLTKFK